MEISGGQNLTRDPRKRSAILVDTDEMVVVRFGYAPGEPGPDLHIHDHHADSFLVLEGELTVRLADTTVTAGPGTLVTAPPGVAHTFANTSEAPVEFLNMHTPGMGFGRYLRQLRAGGERDPFDQREPPPDGGRPASDAVVVRAFGPL